MWRLNRNTIDPGRARRRTAWGRVLEGSGARRLSDPALLALLYASCGGERSAAPFVFWAAFAPESLCPQRPTPAARLTRPDA